MPKPKAVDLDAGLSDIASVLDELGDSPSGADCQSAIDDIYEILDDLGYVDESDEDEGDDDDK
jgi:hypothetical protein